MRSEFVIGNFDSLLPQKSCPKCHGKAEFICTFGDDYLVRCSKCHLCIQQAQMCPESAVEEWNLEHFSPTPHHIAADIKIEDHLSQSIKGISLIGLSKEEIISPEKDDSIFYLDSFSIELENETLSFEIVDDVLNYNFADNTPTTTLVKFHFSKALYNENGHLTGIKLSANDSVLRFSVDSKNDCIKGTLTKQE